MNQFMSMGNTLKMWHFTWNHLSQSACLNKASAAFSTILITIFCYFIPVVIFCAGHLMVLHHENCIITAWLKASQNWQSKCYHECPPTTKLACRTSTRFLPVEAYWHFIILADFLLKGDNILPTSTMYRSCRSGMLVSGEGMPS